MRKNTLRIFKFFVANIFKCLFLSLLIFSGCTEKEELLYINLETDALTFESKTGSQTIKVSSNGDWTILGETDWCEVSSKTGNGNSAVSIIVSKNESPDKRKATLIFRCGAEIAEVKVTQAAKEESLYINLDTNALSFESEDGSKTIEVSSNGDWTVSGETDWCKVSPKIGSGDLSITVTVSENETFDERKAMLIFACGAKTAEVEVTQAEDEEKWVLINGVKWATRNVGASSPEDYGGYYQWNSPTTNFLLYDDYYNSNYSKSTTWLPANDPSPAGYRVPTSAEMESLTDMTYVKYEWTTRNGVYGGRFTDRASGKCIFLPAAGCHHSIDGAFDYVGSDGYFWSSAQYDCVDGSAYCMYFRYGGVHRFGWSGKSLGLSVRPVAD
ncbi:MAG: hypothetical protein LBI82_12640 [Dysgonamonadaceae bacterium]|jgi:uncharacterized protein (TIGR02145 family)|nr:hypothetical protein [Dysgonamonadaceae bacterium]